MPRDTNDTPQTPAGLVYTDSSDPGLVRCKTRGGFVYRDAAGRPVRDEATLERIRRLAAPPAWSQVWICADPRGHIQAVGRDARGRK
ncbi:MAG TPA: DNA topoisomerase IB, partial [Caulobacter sp.]|nr:DNA topoisomerase IB [Caulobacter sp.]